MFSEAPAFIRRIIRFFMLPHCFFMVFTSGECKKSISGIVVDLLKLFFIYKTYPDNYGPCRLWEIDEKEWRYYYGSSYHPYQRQKLRKRIQRFEYQVLFNDKAVCEQLCKGTGVRMPRTYGIIYPALDFRKKISSWFDETPADSLIIKPILGHAGKGIVMAKREGNDILIQAKNGALPLSQFVLHNDAIVQEVLIQDKRLAAFSSSSVNTIRVVTFFTKKEEVIIVSATMRCGVGNSFVDNWSAGGVAVGVDCKTGRLKQFALDKRGKQYRQHPTSKIVFEEFVVPEWQRIIGIAETIQRACPFYCLLGMDITLLEDRTPVLIEVNANPDLVFQEQTSGPLLADNRILNAFEEDELLVNKYQRTLIEGLDKK
jgi:glutathione synthase/RimK-type ligase-like ATP-grasp enzyme